MDSDDVLSRTDHSGSEASLDGKTSDHDQVEFIANIPIRDAPTHGFRKVIGAANYIDVTPPRPASSLSSHQPTNSLSSRPNSVMSSVSSNSNTMTTNSFEKLKIIVFLGSVRENRQCTRVAKYIQNALLARNHHVTVLDPKEHNLGQIVQPIHFYKNPSDVPKEMMEINKQIETADAFILLAAEYNSGISPALCSLLGNFPPSSYQHRPSAIVTYSMGQFGGIRSAMQLRQYLSDLQTVHIPSMIVIPKVHEILSEDGVLSEAGEGNLKNATEKTISQLEWYADALKKQKESSGMPK